MKQTYEQKEWEEYIFYYFIFIFTYATINMNLSGGDIIYIAPPTDQGEVRACSTLHFGTY